jgi:NADPH-dependent curcumin reductase CurA
VDPYLRGMIAKLGPGHPMISGMIGEVVESKSDKFAVGDHLCFMGLWTRLQVVDPKSARVNAYKVDGKTAPLSGYLGVLGMPGATAYFGLKVKAEFKAGDIVFVSGAAGAVGSLVGQLAKLWGAKLVVGSAGGPEKCKNVVEKLGFDACIDYKQFDTQQKVVAELKRLSPEGFDIYLSVVTPGISLHF